MFYCEKRVYKGRSDKWCDMCGKKIPKGTPHMTIPNLESYVTKVLCDDCYDECETLGIEDVDALNAHIYAMEDGEYDEE